MSSLDWDGVYFMPDPHFEEVSFTLVIFCLNAFVRVLLLVRVKHKLLHQLTFYNKKNKPAKIVYP